MSAPSTQPRPPASPTYILRGHASPIHGLHIFSRNLRIISGDADGWIIVWDLVFKRPVAVWKAHEGAILEVKAFSLNDGNLTEVYTHGRDHKLCVWRFRIQDEEFLEKTLPVDVGEQQSQASAASQTQPWLVHSLPVNALNFCAFSILFIDDCEDARQTERSPAGDTTSPENTQRSSLIAVPNALNSGSIDIFTLPRERRLCTIPPDTTQQVGMVMAVNLFYSSSGDVYVASAYEDGHVMVFARKGPVSTSDVSWNWKWEKLYVSRPHSQPALSIDVFSAGGYFLSSSADALLVKHPVPELGAFEEAPVKSVNTKHASQQGLRIRSDGKVFSTAGWDSRVRVYSCKTMRELAVLKWHKEGCYAVTFAEVFASFGSGGDTTGDEDVGKSLQITRRENGDFSLANVQRQRNEKVQSTHWLAAGSKDGKISLWDIY
ncbi:Guanine nucleotide binding protein (G protein), beta polypeptide 1-like [Aspergillus alliaceus]|uniref:ASTRA-associated protein 1 n=1 Tax=Petromyces alliaceus TaxID=209559 RepID=A0A5N7CCU2_PETAA|nr:WD repeat protein [Aspergillus alliaceus]KAF5865410.1 Guanine nucleotide binding protein (G protein), beta polypeptide 1-like [Aspergillus burnettii]